MKEKKPKEIVTMQIKLKSYMPVNRQTATVRLTKRQTLSIVARYTYAIPQYNSKYYVNLFLNK